MNYKHLSKYHYIYRIRLTGNLQMHVEKLPIAYSNKRYIYVIIPGEDALERLSLLPYTHYDISDVYTEVTDKVKEAINRKLFQGISDYGTCYAGFSMYFLIDDPEELEKIRTGINLKAYELSLLDSDVVSREKDVKRCEANLTEAKRKLAEAKYKLLKFSNGIPEGVSL